jgi:hypothetical protein
MLMAMTEHIARGCAQCKKSIAAGTKYYFDTATRSRYHAECKPREMVVKGEDKPAVRVEVRR